MLTQPLEIVLAPLRGLTGALFRTTFARYFAGIDRAVAPFLTPAKGGLKASRLHELLPAKNTGMPVVPQILSKTADNFIELARALHDLGYGTVNWNLGCPFPKVARKLRGSGLLPHPEKVEAFLEEVIPAVPVRISIKARLGRQRPEEVFSLLPVFNRYPLAELILHARTGVQMYAGSPDLDTFERCLPLCRCPVVYNGDISTPADFDCLRRRFPGITSWMIGRGALANPFLPALIKGIPLEEVDCVALFRAFHDELYAGYARVRCGPAHLVDSMKGYWRYFASSFAAGDRLLKRVRQSRTPEQYESIVSRFFETEARDNFFGITSVRASAQGHADSTITSLEKRSPACQSGLYSSHASA